MTKDFSETGEVNITTIPYIEEMVKYFTNHNDTMKTSTTPESGHLFNTQEMQSFSRRKKLISITYFLPSDCLTQRQKGQKYITQ